MRSVAIFALSLALLTGCPDPKTPIDTGDLPDDTGNLTDADGDGFSADEDCDDGNPDVFPGADELCNERDDDCDGETDEDPVDATTFYADADADGYGDPETSAAACSAPSGWVEDATDCDDADETVHPDAEDVCNERDDDCDGEVDEDHEQLSWYQDADADGFGDAEVEATACSQPEGFVGDASDCDDSDDAVNPDATEICNDVDDDCDDAIDEDASDMATWYADADSDGYGDAAITTSACEQPSDHVADASDCDDSDDAINPGASELCNGVDDDCDGFADDGLTYSTWYADADGDGYGSSLTTTSACAQPSGYVADATDCDDTDAATSPVASETCNGADDDCDGSVDEGVTTTFYADADGDGYGDPAGATEDCSVPSGHVADSSDCDDADATAYPGADEICDGNDNDCDGLTDADDALASGEGSVWFTDSDGDGYGDPTLSTTTLCVQPSGTVVNDSDCDDSDAGINPGAAEVCGDGVDDDCSGVADDGCVEAEEHCGTISSDTTWAAGSVHLITCDLYVQGSSRPTLTIEDGVRVEVDAGYAVYVGWSSYGSLEVQGSASGVLLSSSESSPAVGDWKGLTFGSYDQGSELTGLTVEYGGGNGYGGIYMYSSAADMDACTVQYNDNAGIYIAGSDAPRIINTLIANNQGDGISADTGSLSVSGGATFTGNEITANAGFAVSIPAVYGEALDASSTYMGNDDDYVVLMADTVDNDGLWQALDVPWLVDGDVYIQGSSRPGIEIEDGAELYFEADARLLIGWSSYGSMTIEASLAGVLMSSVDSSPASGDWKGLWFGSYDQGSSLEGVWVEYAGGGGYGAIYAYASDLELVDSVISDSSDAGFYGTSSLASIRGCSFLDNDEDGVTLTSSAGLSRSGSPSFSGNTMTGNGGYPISLPANYLGELAADNVMSANGDDYVEVLGDTVDEDATWRDLQAPYRFTDIVYIQGSSTPEVEILDGAELYFDSGVPLYVGWSSYGELGVLGSSTGVLMSSVDASPAPGDWDGLSIGSYAATCTIDGLTLEYGGDNGYGGLYLYAAEAEITDSVFQNNDDAGVYVRNSTLDLKDSMVLDNDGMGVELDSSGALSTSGTPSFTGNIVSGNSGYPLVIPAAFVGQLDASSSYTGNGSDLVQVLGDTVDDDATWQDLGLPLLLEGDVAVQGSSRPELTILAGVELRLEANVALTAGASSYGALSVQGSAAAPVLFTSAQASPAAGDWDGIMLGSYCTDADTSIQYATIEYGGDNGYGDVYLYACDASIDDATVTDSSSWGIYVRSSSPTIGSISYSGNASGDLYL